MVLLLQFLQDNVIILVTSRFLHPAVLISVLFQVILYFILDENHAKRYKTKDTRASVREFSDYFSYSVTTSGRRVSKTSFTTMEQIYNSGKSLIRQLQTQFLDKTSQLGYSTYIQQPIPYDTTRYTYHKIAIVNFTIKPQRHDRNH